MPAFHPRPEDLPEEFPIFPLAGALLLPRGRLPLNIFEPRYLAMVEDALASGRMFGMIQPDATASSGLTGPATYRVGCLGRLSSFSETEDGRFLITLTGLARFEVVQELPMRRGYRRVRADFQPYLPDLEFGDRPAAALDRPRLIGVLRSYFRAKAIEANWDAVEATPDAMLVTTLAMVCPFPPAEKQALLEAGTPDERARMLVALMEIGAHGDPAGSAPPS